jgi:hypothetical protein
MLCTNLVVTSRETNQREDKQRMFVKRELEKYVVGAHGHERVVIHNPRWCTIEDV